MISLVNKIRFYAAPLYKSFRLSTLLFLIFESVVEPTVPLIPDEAEEELDDDFGGDGCPASASC